MGTYSTLFKTALVMCLVTLVSAEAWARPKIGVLLYTQENHYKETLNGILDQLAKEGFGESQVEYMRENAEGNKAKAVEVSRKFSASGMDLVIVLGTTAALIALNEIKDAPIVFSMVYDPVDSKIVRDWNHSGNNATGSSNNLPMSSVVNALKSFAPVKKLAVLYQPNENNSVNQLKDLQQEQAAAKIKMIPVPISTKEELIRILPSVMGSADALYLAGGSVLGEMVPEIADAATRAKKITVSNLKERVEKGVLLGVCANSYQVGLLAGENAAQVLRGAKPSSIPIGKLKKFDVLINMKTAKTGQFPIPSSFMKTVTKTIE